MGKVGIQVQDEFGNIKGENDFSTFQRACLPLRTHELAAYIEENGGVVLDARKDPLVRQAWAMYQSGAPSITKHQNEPAIGQHGITQGPPPEDPIEEAIEPLEEDPGIMENEGEDQGGADTVEGGA